MACLCKIKEYQKHMETFDQNVDHITNWIIQADALLDESEKKKLQQKEDILKHLKAEMNDIRPKVDSTRDQAANLMANRGDHCRKVVEPKISELNRRFAAISHRIKTGKVGRSAPRWKLVVNDVLRRLCSTLRGASNPRSKVFKRKMKARMYLRKFYH